MKFKNFFYFLSFALILLSTLPVIQSCSNDDESDPKVVGDDPDNEWGVSENTIDFQEINVNTVSSSKSVTLTAEQLTSEINLVTEGDYIISLNDSDFSNELSIPTSNANGQHIIYIKFTPQKAGVRTGKIMITNTEAATLNVQLNGSGAVMVTNVKAFENTALYPDVPENCMSTAFAHIFQGGYSSGYYSYKWAEVLDADAFEYFKEKGIFNKTVADKFKDNVLSKGGTENPMTLYKRFRGQEPKPEALLKRAGLIDVK